VSNSALSHGSSVGRSSKKVVGGGGATMGAMASGDQVVKKVPFLSLACTGTQPANTAGSGAPLATAS